ncbi:MAG: hypothetical protein ACLP1X_20860 [Polyangiaceae bacterium]
MPNPAFTVECRVGRVVEARLMTLRDAADVTQFGMAMRAAFVRLQRKCVICADVRAFTLLSPTVSDLMVGVLANGNPHLERSAILLPTKGAAFHLQAERLVRESKSADRRTFNKPQEMAAWLGEILDDAERARVRAFLSG